MYFFIRMHQPLKHFDLSAGVVSKTCVCTLRRQLQAMEIVIFGTTKKSGLYGRCIVSLIFFAFRNQAFFVIHNIRQTNDCILIRTHSSAILQNHIATCSVLSFVNWLTLGHSND